MKDLEFNNFKLMLILPQCYCTNMTYIIIPIGGAMNALVMESYARKLMKQGICREQAYFETQWVYGDCDEDVFFKERCKLQKQVKWKNH